ncbi:MAG: Wadjet anti-phage system protein JetA family protein [Pseudoxanthomonas sp.]
MDASSPPLFDRLPATLFRPLAAANNRRYWALLSRLMAELWGDGGRSPGEEAPKHVVVRAIESFLAADDPWDEELDSPLAVRAYGIYTVLCDSGWLTQRRRGVVDHVTVRPVIAQFFTVLVDFAQHEPEFLGSKVRSIFLNLREVASGGAPELYPEAARQAKHVMAHIANTGCRVQDLMDELVTRTTARDFVRGFFEEYIEKVFIADYTEFRTHNHPLQHRAEIVRLAIGFQHEPLKRQALIDWYAQKQTNGDLARAEFHFERDTRLLLRLRDVEEHLRRLDEEIRIAHQRAMAYFEYKLRSPGSFDKLISRAIDASGGLVDGHYALPNRTGSYHASEHGLARPRQLPREVVATPVEQDPPTIEEQAKEALRQRMNADRLVTPVKLAAFVARHLNGKKSVTADDLQIQTINDLCCYQRLLLIASRDQTPVGKRTNDVHLQMVPGMHVAFVPMARTRNEHMEHQRFVILTGKG